MISGIQWEFWNTSRVGKRGTVYSWSPFHRQVAELGFEHHRLRPFSPLSRYTTYLSATSCGRLHSFHCSLTAFLESLEMKEEKRHYQINLFCSYKSLESRGSWLAQSVKCTTLDFGSGHDLTFWEFESHIGLSAVSTQPAWDPLSPPLRSVLPLVTLSLKNK